MRYAKLDARLARLRGEPVSEATQAALKGTPTGYDKVDAIDSAPPVGEQAVDPKTPPPPPPAAVTPVTQPAADTLTPMQRQAMQDAVRAEREAYETKQRMKQLEDEAKTLREQAEARKKLSPLELLAEERGVTYEQLTKDIIDGKYTPPTAEQLEIKGTKSKLQQLEEELASFKAEREQTAQRLKHEQMASVIQRELTEQYAERYPTLAALPDAGALIVETHAKHVKQNPQLTFDQVAAHIEQERSSFLKQAAASDAVLKQMFADPAVKARALSLLGAKSEPAAQQVPQGIRRVGNGPDAIPSSRAGEPGTRSDAPVQGREARLNRALGAVNRKRQASLG